VFGAVAAALGAGIYFGISALTGYEFGLVAIVVGLMVGWAVRRGAEVIVTLSNDSWFAEGNGPRLHLVVSAFRSLETRRPQLRATNTGISAVITSTGEIVATAGVHERKAVVASVTPGTASTLMLKWGNWFGPTALASAIVLLGIALTRRDRRERG